MNGYTTIDGGHDAIKATVDMHEIMIPHLVSEMDKERFDAMARESAGRNPNFIHVKNRQRGVNGYFAIGEGAARTGLRLERARRYRPDYLGAMLCGIWANHYDNHPDYRTQFVTTMFPAADWHAVEQLRESLSGNWTVTPMNSDPLRFQVQKSNVQAVPEPIGGFLHIILDSQGNQRPNWHANGYNPLIIDIGAGTLQVVEMGRGYQLLDPDRIGVSYPLGVNQAIDDFITGLYHLNVIGDTSSADRLLYRDMLQQGIWTGRGSQQQMDSIHRLMDSILETLMGKFTRHLQNHDLLSASHIFLTGGGAALLARPLLGLLEPDDSLPPDQGDLKGWAEMHGIIFADDLDALHFANARGARKASLVRR
jgi:hypothetical protein